MARPRRVSSTGWYHAMGRGNNRQALFRSDDDYLKFLQLAGEYLRRSPVQLAHYCLMSNHVHLLLFSENRVNLSKILQGINLSYSWWFRRRYDFCGHVWQGRFKSVPIQEESHLLECGRYIERNPANAKIVSNPADYLWSSYRFYSGGEENSLLTSNPCYQGLGETKWERQRRYREYVTVSRPYEPKMEEILAVSEG